MSDETVYFEEVPLTDELLVEWFETFSPNVRSFATHFVLNILPKYRGDIDAIENESDRMLAKIVSGHFRAFLNLRFVNQDPPKRLVFLLFE